MSLFMSNYSIYNPRLVPHLETGSHDSFTDSAGCVLNYSLSFTQSMWGKHFILIKSNADFWWIWWKLAQKMWVFLTGKYFIFTEPRNEHWKNK